MKSYSMRWFVFSFYVGMILSCSNTVPSELVKAGIKVDDMKRIETIKIDSTRGDLLKLFQAPAGISNPFSATFQYRECSNLFVDVVIEREYDENGQLVIGVNNRIISISSPYVKNTSKD